jgi:hypothetical protein
LRAVQGFLQARRKGHREGAPRPAWGVPESYRPIDPPEHKVEHRNRVKELSDEQLEAAIEYIEAALAAKAGDQAKVIEWIAEPAALPTPELETQRKRPKRLLEHADSAVGPEERRPRKREVPSPSGG